ncbi:MAG TPA: hypothetical protein VGB42_03620 [Candidatus Thermoplasmatota archaeon]
MSATRTHPKRYRTRTLAALLVLLMVGSSWMAAVPATARVSVDDVVPGSYPAAGAGRTDSQMPKVEANVTQWDNTSVTVDTTVEWLAGSVGPGATVSGGALTIGDSDREPFSGTGDPNPLYWDWGDQVVQSGGFLVVQSDTSAGDNWPFIRMNTSLRTFDLSQHDDLALNSTSEILSMSQPFMYVDAIGWWDPGTGAKFGVRYVTDSVGNVTIDLYGWDPWNGADDGANTNHAFNQPLALQVVVTDAASGTVEAFALINATWTSLGTITADFSSSTGWVPFAGRGDNLGSGEDFLLQIDYIESAELHLRPDSTSYMSAGLSTGLGYAYISTVQVVLASGTMGGISNFSYRYATDEAGLANATSWLTPALNMPVDEEVGPWMQFQFTLYATPAAEVDRVTFEITYHHDVMLLRYDDFRGASVNPDTWSGSAPLDGQLLALDSSSADPSMAIRYRNATWDLASSFSVEGYALIESRQAAAAGDTNVLLPGFVITDDTGAVTGYAGLVRMSGGSSGFYGVTVSNGTGVTSTPSTVECQSTRLVRFSFEDGTFMVEAREDMVGWFTVGSVDIGMSSGTAHLVFGAVATPSGSQEVRVDWVGVVERHLVAALGDSWETADIQLAEDYNSFMVLAVEGPNYDYEVLEYVRDTVAPVGTFTVNNGMGSSSLPLVSIELSATDRYGVSFYAVSESLSFPEGWKPYPANGQASFLLSSGDGRKVLWARFMDSHGVISVVTNQSIILDTVDPTGALYLNDRNSTTSTRQVELTMLAFDEGGVDAALVSNSPDLSGAVTVDMKVAGVAQRAITQVVPWTLSAGDGFKSVYVQFVDVNGRSSSLPYYNATILLDSTAPAVTATLLNTLSRDNTLYLNTTVAVVRVSASDASGLDSIEISPDSTFDTARSYTAAGDLIYDLPPGSGLRTLHVRATDVYGLVSSPVVRIEFVVDVSAPTGSIAINNDAEVTTTRTVQLTLSATDNIAVAEMQLSTSLYFLGAVWQPFSPTASIDLSLGDGAQKTVYVRYRDVNGRESQAFFDTIALDTTPPSGFIIVNNGDVSTVDRNLNLQLEAFDNFGGVLEMRVGTSADLSAVTWRPFSENFRIDAGVDEGNVTVYYQIRDSNGLISETYTDGIRVRVATCADTNTCIGPTQPGFEGSYALVAVGLVGLLAVLGRRRQRA